MPRGRQWAVYVRDDQVTVHSKLVDSDAFLDVNRGWSDFGVENCPGMPIGARARAVHGVSSTSGRSGTALVATTTADLWTGIATTFDVEGTDGALDTMTVVRRVGGYFPTHLAG
jgi:hypothetical protein